VPEMWVFVILWELSLVSVLKRRVLIYLGSVFFFFSLSLFVILFTLALIPPFRAQRVGPSTQKKTKLQNT
jgi:hypothetical protein